MSRRIGYLLLTLFVLACSPPPPPAVPNAPVAMVPVAAAAATNDEERAAVEADEVDPDPGPIPVTSADPSWGRRDAPVTIVEFSDFQCPFCARARQTIAELQRTYGPEKLRTVWKNNPLPFHPEARPSAAVAMALYERLGNKAFWEINDTFFGDQRRLADAEEDVAARAGTTLAELRASPAWGRAEAKIDADMALGKAIGVTGTPAFFINGVLVSGAQPIDKFTAVVDEQLAKAKSMIAQGTPPKRVYAELTKAQKQAAPPPPATKVADDSGVVHRVPVGKSPVRGKATALVTIVEFADFQCPFCARVAPTVATLLKEYGDKVRFVFKHNPLPFHPRAEPAAELVLEARAQRGDKGFWSAYDLLFDGRCDGGSGADRASCEANQGSWSSNSRRLDDADLAGYAKALGLDVGRVTAAIASKKHAATITEDQDLSDDMQANGTPHFFINGRRFVGAQPIEKFREVIDEEIVKAQALVKQGVAPDKLYDKILAQAPPPAAMEQKTVPAPTAASPSRGAAKAKVVVQVFADFQCPFCKRVLPTIEELEKAYPGKLRIVWRNLPLSFHQNALPSAQAAMEAFAQKGSAGFWAMHDLMFQNQGQTGALERAALLGYAAQLGLDVARVADAIDNNRHQAEIDADTKIASAAGIQGTPAFVINGFFVSGAQPLAKFKKVVNAALAAAK
jgi:protein-disulfide isomerase